MEGTLVKGGIGPEDAELGVDVPDEAGVDAGVFLRADFFAMVIMVFLRLLGIVFRSHGLFLSWDVPFGASLVRS